MPASDAEVYLDEMRAMLAKPFDAKPNKAWATRLLARNDAGEPICSIGIEWAREVAGQQQQREPGSDDE